MDILLAMWMKLNTLDSLDFTKHLNKPVVEAKKDEKPPKRGEGRRNEGNK